MTIQQVLQKVGRWSLRLKPGAPPAPDGPDIDAQCNIVREIGRRTVTVPSVHHASIPSTLGTPLVTPDLAALAQHVLAYVEEAAR